MAVTRYCSLFLAGLLVIGGAGATAQTQETLAAEKNRLARMEQSQENRAVEMEDIENEILSYDYKLKRAEESLEKARQHYDESRSELEQAQSAHQQKGNSDTERALHKAKHGFKMAERGVDSRTRRVEFIRENYKELQAELDEAKSAIARGESRIADQERKIEKVVNTMLAKADAAKRAASVEKAAAPVSKPEVPAPSVAEVEPESQPQPKAAEPAREIDPELLEYVKGEKERLEKLLSDGEEGKHTFRTLDLEPTRGESIPFEFLGHNQYRLVAPVEAGRQTYEINTWKFRRTIPADDDGVRYVFIFDGRRLSRPRLVMYPEYVLDHLKD
ncbi:hypothetical protein [Microbulbifer halophilus]|uniref:Uncharacterized protein n=1 Tax=Microbulbifer halophilus TaxID=453963 RepID=A0ABW5EAH5_9GAMM|nr:hypothetical protein [Microbulbifer halophilus]MCW8128281.1 hypothetical protein [Microbulbifer halophilus]